MKEIEFIKKLNLVFREKKYIFITIIFSVLIGFVYAILAELIPIPNLNSSIRMIPFTSLDAIFLIVFPLIAGVTIAFYFYNSKNRAKGVCTTSSGIFLGLLTGVCPYCPIVLLLLIGMSISIQFLSPIFPYLRIISLSLLLVSLYWASKGIETKKRVLSGKR